MENEENSRIIFKIIYILKRLSDEWGELHFSRPLNPKFKISYMPTFMCIGKQGISNNEIAKELKVTKMAASKTIKELQELGLVRSEKNLTDARSETLYLTEEGEIFNQKLKRLYKEQIKEYKKVVGNANYESAIDVLLKINQYHETLKLK